MKKVFAGGGGGGPIGRRKLVRERSKRFLIYM